MECKHTSSSKKIDYFKSFVFLHIPADKIFLSKCYDEIKKKQNFKDEYFKYIKNYKNKLRLTVSYLLPTKVKEK